jgi:hypothetical protein
VAIITLGVVAVTADGNAATLSGPIEGQSFLNVVMSIAPVFALLLGLRSFTTSSGTDQSSPRCWRRLTGGASSARSSSPRG